MVIALIILIIIGCMVLFGFSFHALTLIPATTMATRMKQNYLGAILKQDCSWFDQTNHTELSSRMVHEVDFIKKAVGEKFAMIINSIAMTISGFAIGFGLGWSLACSMLVIGPILIVGMTIFFAQLTNGMAETMKTYGQSAGYAEQALSAVRVVVAFG